MNEIRYIMYIIIFGILSQLVFSIILKGLNDSVLNLFAPLQKVVRNLKNKKKIKLISTFISITICIVIADLLNLGAIKLGILFGFIYSFVDLIYDTEIASTNY